MSAENITRTQEERVFINPLLPLDTPINVLIDPSSSCNLRCSFCPTSDAKRMREIGKFRGNMSLDLFKTIIDELGQFTKPIKNLHLSKDGEPLLNKFLPEMIKYAKKSGYVEQITVTTNATLLDKDMADRLASAGLDRLRISLEGLDEEDYLTIAKYKVDFSDLVEKIKYFCSIRRECHVHIKVPENCISKKPQEYFYELFEDVADSCAVEQIVQLLPSYDIPELYDIDKEKGLFHQNVKKKDVCGFIFYSIAVSAEGLVSPCCIDWAQDLTIGDTTKNSLFEIWNSDELQLLRIQHLSLKAGENPVCKNCNAPNVCCLENVDPERERVLEVLQGLDIDYSKVTPGMGKVVGDIGIKQVG